MVDEAAKRAGYGIRAYHGTGETFTKFAKAKSGANYEGYLEYGAGFYFTPSREEARKWSANGEKINGNNVMSVYLAAERMMNPDESISDDSAESILKRHGYFQNDIEFTLGRGYRFIEALIHFGYSNAEIQKQLKAMGYDGVDASYGKENKTGQYVIFDPEQVKSADLVTYDDEGNIIPLSERFRTDRTDTEAWKNEDIRYSVREIIGNGGKNYGVGVKLDSTLLANLSPEERIQMVKEYVKELGGKEFSAFDNDGNAVSVRIAESNRRFMNKNGKRVRVNNDLAGKYIGNEVKQEAISLVDELVFTSKYFADNPSRYPHGWLDNNGKNAWQYWTTFIQDKENTVWKATLNIANTAYGEKVLYDINPIEMVEQSVKSDTVSTNDSIAQKSNTVNTIISEKSKNSTEKYSDRDYSYDNLVSKPDMKVTQIGTEAPSNRADIVFEAKRNASKIGKFNVKDGSVSVYVDDIGTDVILGTDGLKHGLRRSKNISTDINSLAILNAGEIIKHSVKINEIIPKDKNATSSYVLIGCAENSSSRFIVRSIINTFDNSLSKMDVLYAVKVKESAAQPAPGSAAKAVSSVTDSKISITDLLEIVNRHYPDILPESVLKHFGYSERPSGDLAVSALYSFRDTKSGMANDKLSPYSEELAQFIEQKGDYIVDNFDKLKQVVNLAFDNPSVKATAYFGIINRETLSEIKESIPNLPKASKEILFKDGRDYSIATTLDSIRHIVDEKCLSRDDVIDYLDRLADTVVEFDTVSFDYYYDSYKNRIPGLLFKKSFEDGKLISFDIVSQKKRSLSLQAIYLESVDYEKKKSAETLLLQNSHSRTPEVGVGQTSDNRVAQFDDNVKGKIEKSLDSDRDITLSSRYLLANALESTARNEVERDWLGRYKADIEKYNAEQDKLTTLNAQIKELSFGKGKRDMAKLRQLRDEKIKTGQYVIFDPEQVKSADLVTYDDEGNIIPLSERFRTDRTDAEAWKNEDIRYSARELDSDGSEYWQIESEKDIFRGINENSALRKAAYNFILHGDKGNKIFGLIDGKNLGNIGLLLFRTKKIPYGRQRLI